MKETIAVEGIGNVEVRFVEGGSGQRVLLLHGGGGPASVEPWAELLALTRAAHVIVPTHPGLGGTPRPETLNSVGGLARAYAAFIDTLALDGVCVMGHSIGGWIAAEMALLSPARISSLVLIDAVGIHVAEHPAADVFGGPPRRGGDGVLQMYARNMMDPTLRPRLGKGALPPTLLAWGEQDDVVDSGYGRAYARAIPGAKFVVLPSVGHSPQLEAPDLLAATVWPFVLEHAWR